MTSFVGPSGILVVAHVLRQSSRLPRADFVHEDVEPPVDSARVGYPIAVGRPGGRVVVVSVVGETADVGPLRVHDVNLRVAGAVGGEGDFPAGRRPDWRGVSPFAEGDLPG